MRRIFLLIAVFCMAISQAFAGDGPDGPESFVWGVNGGLNISKVDGSGKGFADSGWDVESGQGYWAGVQFRWSMPVVGLGLDFGVNYSQETAAIKTKENKSVSDKLKFINVPIHLRYDLNLPAVGNYVIPFVFAGPEVNYSISDLKTLLEESPHNFHHDQTSQKAKDALKSNKFIWRVDLGLGVILFKHLQLAYSYAIPLTDTFKFNEDVYKDSKANFKMGTHRIGATYFF